LTYSGENRGVAIASIRAGDEKTTAFAHDRFSQKDIKHYFDGSVGWIIYVSTSDVDRAKHLLTNSPLLDAEILTNGFLQLKMHN